MELKLGQLINSQEVIEGLAKGKFKAKTTWRLTALVKAMEEYIGRFHDLRNDLIKKYGTEKDGAISVDQTGEDFSKFVDELNEVAGETIELNVSKISIDDIENYEISIEDLMKIDWLIED